MSNQPSLIVMAIPFFLVAILLELAYDIRQRRKHGAEPLFRTGDAISNFGTGILEQVMIALWPAGLVAAYAYVFERARLFTMNETSWLTWAFAFAASDFMYYWWHRLSHEVNFLWAGHAVHHQSEDYNLTVALRQNWYTNLTAIPFYLPLALLGVPLAPFVAMKSFMILYQFWIHTRVIGKLGPAELVMNTPSHHRVHHGVNPIYIDKNYAGTFIIWDRMFGTFTAETEEVFYGTVKPLASFDPIWGNIYYWLDLMKQSAACPRFKDKLRVWVAAPGWRPLDLGGPHLIPAVSRESRIKYDCPASPLKKTVALSFFVVVLLGTAVFLFSEKQLSTPVRYAGAAGVALGLIASATLIEGVTGFWQRLTTILGLSSLRSPSRSVVD